MHGFTIDHRLLMPFESEFAGREGRRRTYLDLPGFGDSPRLAAMSADPVAGAVVEFVRERVGAGAFAVVGMSFGGVVARHALAER